MPRYNSYNDYITAAQRHRMTCDYLIKSICLPNNQLHKPDNSSYKNYLLKNIYYLSGYTIECMVNYAIYKCVNETKPVNRQFTLVDQLNEPVYNLGFRSHYYSISSHRFQRNMEVLNLIATAKFAQVPIIGGTIYPNNWNVMQSLFNGWKPHARYTNVGYSEQQIISFYELSSEIYTNIRSCITT